MNHASNDVKQLLAIIATFVAKSIPKLLPSDLLRSLLVCLNENYLTFERAFSNNLFTFYLAHARQWHKGEKLCCEGN